MAKNRWGGLQDKVEDSDTTSTIERLSQNLDLNIQLTSLRPSRLTLSTNAYLAPDDQRAYFRLDTERKNPFFELSVGRYSISMWITKSILAATPYSRYLSLRPSSLMD